MLIYLLRHGIAEDSADSDAARELSLEGREQTRSVVRQFQSKKAQIDKVLVSPLQRAIQTAYEFRAAIPGVEFQMEEKIVPSGDVFEILETIEGYQQAMQVNSLLMVSHNPLLSKLLSLLVDGSTGTARPFSPSHLYCIEAEIIAPGCGTIRYTLQP